MQDYSWESILANMEKEKIETIARANTNKKILFNLLKKNNVELVLATFDGSGDSGSINLIEFTPDNTHPLLEEPALGFHWPAIVWPTKKDITVKEAIETICYDYLRVHQLGWETDEGSYGVLEFIVQENKIKLEFNERSVSQYYDEF